MIATRLLGRLLGLEQSQSIDSIRLALAAAWTQNGAAWLVFGCAGLVALAVVFYARYQGSRRVGARVFLGAVRAAVLCLLFVILAEPILTVRVTSRLRPSLWLLFDGTDSMAVRDEIPEAERVRLAQAVGLAEETGNGSVSPQKVAPPRRIDYVRALVSNPEQNLVARLAERFRLRAFLFDRPDGVRAIGGQGDIRIFPGGPPLVSGMERSEPPARRHAAEALRSTTATLQAHELTTEGEVTAIGAALEDLARRHSTANLAGVLIVSDFNQNAGPPPLEAARRLGARLYTVGVGPAATVDLAVDLQAPPVMKKDERSSLVATLRQEGLAGQTVEVRFFACAAGGKGESRIFPDGRDAPAGKNALVPFSPIGQQTVTLTGPTQTVELPYVPTETGRLVLAAEVQPLEGEVVGENNRAERETTVRDDFIRLLFVEYEPTWEWRFVKEVFHRDKLVGMRGFRTFLRSADPEVRKTNELFLPTLSLPRSEFFAHDVIVLGDMPASALSPLFCRMAEEFVGEFGGGLVVVAGPRFGPGEIAQTILGDLLPVKVDPNARRRDTEPFLLHRTPDADQYDFMRLGQSARENEKAWENLGPLCWYQPVERLRPLATALAEHPADTCVDRTTRQPLIAVQNYGRGEVVYLGFNEMWRLRRRYGEQYYRQFWGQLIHRLALRHALGSEKRFVVRTDRRQYRADDQVLLTVEAYDAEFQPLTEQDVPERRLSAEMILPDPGGRLEARTALQPPASNVRAISIPQLREGVFEARIPVFTPGEHRICVHDPIAQQEAEVAFQVTEVSAERQRAVRNVVLQEALAEATGGKSYDLTTVHRLPEQIDLPARTETSIAVVPLWNTWLSFACVVLLMLGEWLGRKWVNLP